MVLKFHMQHDQNSGLNKIIIIIKLRMVENPRLLPVLKITKLNQLFLQNGLVYLADICMKQ